MDKYTKAVLTVIALLVGTGFYLDHKYGFHRYPPQIGKYEEIAIWGEGYLRFVDPRPPAYAVIYVPVRRY